MVQSVLHADSRDVCRAASPESGKAAKLKGVTQQERADAPRTAVSLCSDGRGADQAACADSSSRPSTISPTYAAANRTGGDVDPLVLVALHAYPGLLSLDDLLAARCVCRSWRARLGTSFASAFRLPHSLWSAAGSPRLSCALREAAAAYRAAPIVLLDAGGWRPGVAPEVWPPVLDALEPWLAAESSSGAAPRRLRLHLAAPPSPSRLAALGLLCGPAPARLPLLHSLKLQHTGLALYTRHLDSLAQLTGLRALSLISSQQRMDLRSLAHARGRRHPLRCDCLSILVALTRLEIVSQGPGDELLPESAVAFSHSACLAALTALRCLSLAEAALTGPEPAGAWLAPLVGLTHLQLVQLDDVSARTAGLARRTTTGSGGGGSSSSSGGGVVAPGTTAAAAAAAAAANLLSSSNLLGSTGGLSALAAAAAAAAAGAGSSATAAAAAAAADAEQAALLLEQQQQQLAALLPALQGHITQQSMGRTSSSAEADACGGSSGGSSAAAGTAAAAAAAAKAAAPPPPPPLDLATATPRLRSLHLANLCGGRLLGLRLPKGLTALTLSLASPSAGDVTGDQLAAVVLQAAPRLAALELGLGQRFSMTGAAMRSLKRGLKGLRSLTLVEGGHDHLEGLGCWCGLPRLVLVQGRCPVPLRGLYELSMRAAMGRMPGVLRYSGHVRHIEELSCRLGGALHELRLDSLGGLAAGSSSSGGGGGGGGGDCSGSSNSSSGGGGQQPCADGGGTALGKHCGSSCSESASVINNKTTSAANTAAAAAPAGPSSELLLGHQPSAAGGGGAAAPPAAALASLTGLRRLEVVGSHIGVLDGGVAAAITSLTALTALEVVGAEPWLSHECGVKEQLAWLAVLPRLRLLRLGGVMLGRARLAACGAGGVAGSNGKASGGCAGGGRSAVQQQAAATPAAPAVKGLGNGLPACGGARSGSSGGGAAVPSSGVAAPATAAVAVPELAPPLDMQAAAERDLAVSVSLEELRRWLCQLLPHARVWLD